MHLRVEGLIIKSVVNVVGLLWVLLFSSLSFADQLIIEPDMGRTPILHLINSTQQSLNLVMYGFTEKQLLDAFVALQNKHKTITIILEQSPYKQAMENVRTIGLLKKNGIPWQGHVNDFRFIHQKTMIVDGKKAVVMTFNFTNSTFKNERNFGLVIDDAKKVKEIAAVFAADWNHVPIVNSSPDLIYSPADSRVKMITCLNSAKKSLKIYAQSISDYQMIGALAGLARKGIDIKILTTNQIRKKQSAYLTKAGVKMRRNNTFYIHAKAMVIDDQLALIGSTNLTKASFDDNRELTVVTRDKKVIEELSSIFDRDWVS